MSVKRRLGEFINHPVTEVVVMTMIVVSVILVLVEFSLPHDTALFARLETLNDIVTWFFVLELSVRFYVEKRKMRFFRRYWIDILAVLPLLRAFRILRVLRLLRLFRVGIIASRRLNRFTGAFGVIKAEYVFIALAIMIVVLMGALSMRFAEGRVNGDFGDIEKSLWFAVMTVIGGEPIGGTPKTRLGLMVTVTLMVGGLTVFAVFTGTISAVMVNSLKNLRLVSVELDELEHHVVICGWNRAGRLIIEELLNDERFSHVVVVAEDEVLLEDNFFDSVQHAVYVHTGDYTRTEVLREVGIDRADFAMLLADESKEERSSQDRDARTVLAAMLIEKLNKQIYTTVQLLNRDNETSLRQVGVEEIIVSDEYVGTIMATVTKNRGIVTMLDELLTSKYGHQFYRVEVPPGLVGMSVGEAVGVLKAEHDATLLAVDLQNGKPAAESMLVNPPGKLILESTHHIVVASSERINDE